MDDVGPRDEERRRPPAAGTARKCIPQGLRKEPALQAPGVALTEADFELLPPELGGDWFMPL